MKTTRGRLKGLKSEAEDASGDLRRVADYLHDALDIIPQDADELYREMKRCRDEVRGIAAALTAAANGSDPSIVEGLARIGGQVVGAIGISVVTSLLLHSEPAAANVDKACQEASQSLGTVEHLAPGGFGDLLNERGQGATGAGFPRTDSVRRDAGGDANPLDEESDVEAAVVGVEPVRVGIGIPTPTIGGDAVRQDAEVGPTTVEARANVPSPSAPPVQPQTVQGRASVPSPATPVSANLGPLTARIGGDVENPAAMHADLGPLTSPAPEAHEVTVTDSIGITDSIGVELRPDPAVATSNAEASLTVGIPLTDDADSDPEVPEDQPAVLGQATFGTGTFGGGSGEGPVDNDDEPDV